MSSKQPTLKEFDVESIRKSNRNVMEAVDDALQGISQVTSYISDEQMCQNVIVRRLKSIGLRIGVIERRLKDRIRGE